MIVKGHSEPVSYFNDLASDLTAACERKKREFISRMEKKIPTCDFRVEQKIDSIKRDFAQAKPLNERIVIALESEDSEITRKELTQKRKEYKESLHAWRNAPNDDNEIESVGTDAIRLTLDESELLDELVPLAKAVQEESAPPSTLLWRIQSKRKAHSKDLQKAEPTRSCINSRVGITLLGLALAASYIAHKALEQSDLQPSGTN